MDFAGALLVVLLTGLAKGVVMAVTGWLLVRVYGARKDTQHARIWLLAPDARTPGARWLRLGLVGLGVSELVCGIEIYVLLRASAPLGILHGAISATGMALFSLGLFELLQDRALRFGTPGCAARSLCGACRLHSPPHASQPACRLRLTATILATFVAICALLPMVAPVDALEARFPSSSLAPPRLAAWFEGHVVPWLAAHISGYDAGGPIAVLPSAVLVFEFRVVPAGALILASVAAARLRAGRLEDGARWLAVAAGALAYAGFELALYRGTGDLLLGNLAHEIAELWFTILVAALLGELRGSDPLTARTGSASA